MPSFGKYEVLEKVGEGGFGTVYRGRDPDLKRSVAIKTLSTTDPELRDRFLREAEIAAGLQHPGITTIFDFGVDDGRPYLVQEFLSGEDLDDAIGREGVDRDRRIGWLIQAAEALAHAHSREIVHRDVKPSNLRVLDDGRIKIMDFGIAKLLSAEDQLTRTGMTMGTAGYLPPEQVRGAAVDQRADIFSFGVLTYELLAQKRPFVGDSLSSVLYRIAHEEHPPLREAWPGCPERLARVVDRCLAKDPDDRFPSLEPVIEELRSVRAALADAGREAAAGGRPNPGRVAPTVLAGSGDPAARAAEAPEAGEPSGGSTYRTAFRRPWRPGTWAALAVAVIAAVVLGLWALGPGNDRDRSDAVGEETADISPADTTTAEAEGLEDRGAGVEDEPAPEIVEASTATGPTELAEEAEPESLGDPSPPPVSRPSTPPPGPSPTRPSLERSRYLVWVTGEPASAAGTAGTALARALSDRGLRTVTADLEGSGVAGGAPGPIAEIARRHGAAIVVVATFQGEAQPSAGRFFTGRALLDVRAYRADGELLGSGAAEVGGAGTPGKLAPSELTALNQAAEAVGRRAAAEVVSWTGVAGGES